MNNPTKKFQLWSDGSCLGNPGPGGYAAIILTDSGEEFAVVCGHDRHATNQRMEMKAVAEGLAKVPAGSSVVLFTDSKYVVDGMTKWIKGWKKRGWKKADGNIVANLELWQQIDAEASRRNVEFNHVRGHVGIELNERCDRLANEQSLIAKNGG